MRRGNRLLGPRWDVGILNALSGAAEIRAGQSLAYSPLSELLDHGHELLIREAEDLLQHRPPMGLQIPPLLLKIIEAHRRRLCLRLYLWLHLGHRQYLGRLRQI